MIQEDREEKRNKKREEMCLLKKLHTISLKSKKSIFILLLGKT